MRTDRRNRSTRRKPAPAPLCPPQIPHDLTWARTRAAAVGSRWLTAWAMARPDTISFIFVPSLSSWYSISDSSASDCRFGNKYIKTVIPLHVATSLAPVPDAMSACLTTGAKTQKMKWTDRVARLFLPSLLHVRVTPRSDSPSASYYKV
jgi:hypothetical protein